MLVLLAAALLLSEASDRREARTYLAAAAKEHGVLLDRALELDGRLLATFANDYALWDDMVRFTKTADPTWASVNIDAGMGTFRASAAWVFDAAGSQVYAVRDSLLAAGPEPFPAGVSVKDAFGSSRFCHYFLSGPDGPVEVRGATIQPSEDDLRTTPAQGYFLVARRWDQPYLAELGQLTQKGIRIAQANDGVGTSAEIIPQAGEVRFTRPLPGPKGKPEFMLIATFQPNWIVMVRRSNRSMLLQLAALSLLGLLGLTIALQLLVTRPLGRIRRSLESGSTQDLKPLECDRTEFGQLAQLVGQFADEHAALGKEVVERRRAEQALRESEERFRLIFEAAPDAYYLSDLKGVFVDGNAAVERLLGMGRVELVGKSLLNAGLLPTGSIPRAAALLARSVLGQLTGPDEFELNRKDGSHVAVEIMTHPVTIGGRTLVLGIARDVTERKRAEEALRASEAQLSNAMETAKLGSWEYDVVNDLFTFNDHFYRVFHTTAEQVGSYMMSSAEYARRFVHPEDATMVGIEVRKAIETTDPNYTRQLEHRIIYADGGIGHISVRFFTVKDSQGRTVKTHGANQDITDRKLAEQAVRESEERLRVLYAGITDAVLVSRVGTDGWPGLIVEANDAASRLLGYSRAELLTKSITDISIPVPGPDPRNTATLLQSRSDVLFELVLMAKDGRHLFVEVHAGSLEHCGEHAAVYIVRDVTERNRIEMELRKSEERYRRVNENIQDIIYSVDAQMRVTFASGNSDALLGVPAERLVGQRLEVLAELMQVNGPGPGGTLRCLEQVAAEPGETIEGVVELPPSSAGRRWVEVRARIQHDGSGRPIGSTGVIRDVTRRKQAEETLLAKERELSRSNAELEQFAYIASHDLQEPLRMVGSYTQLLARRYEGKLDEDANEFIGFAVDGVTRMQSLINDLLAYSRVGRRGREPRLTESGKALDRALQNLRLTIKDNNGNVTHDQLPVVMADDRQLEQLFQNLVGNAMKYHGDVPPGVHVSAERSNNWWEFAVKDNGIGIEPQYHERIFQIFQRLHTRNEYAGTGIGLAVCRRIVERHGGKIWVESEPGKGSTFRFTLPAEGA
jgi:PAS domain S-box-containing protein